MTRLAARLVMIALGTAAIVGAARAQQLPPFRASARAIFNELIEINTTHSTGSTTVAAEALRARFLAAGFAPADVEIVGPPESKNHNLLVRYRGNGGRKPVILLAHLDVVEARREDWTYDPFKFTEAGGYFYGRGTSDIKDGAATLVAALLRLRQEKFQPDRDLLLALTAGEESGGDYNGVAWLLEHRPEFRAAAYVLNTDSGDPLARRGKLQARMMQVAEKVAFNFQLEVTNPGGHSSLPVPENAIYRLAAGLVRLGAFRFPIHLSDLTRAFFARSAGLETGAVGADLAAVGRDSPDLEAADRLSRSAFYNAMLRTTCITTTIEGGHAPNALPQRARANVNCRMLPFESADTVEATLRRIIADSAIRLTRTSPARTSPPSPLEGEFPALAARVAAEMWPGVPVIPYMETGATDGLFFRNAGVAAYGASGVAVDPDDVRAHGKDERVGVEAFYQGAEHLYRLIRAVGTPPSP
jgi:acetylornithine deacetylase/succinyl-diaminopimelate desuccinylase-like protein